MPDLILRSSHLVFSAQLAQKLFDDAFTAYVSYKPDLCCMLVSANTNSWFRKLHETREYLLKGKDASGTKSIGVRDLLIDHDIAPDDRVLQFELIADKRYVKVRFPKN